MMKRKHTSVMAGSANSDGSFKNIVSFINWATRDKIDFILKKKTSQKQSSTCKVVS